MRLNKKPETIHTHEGGKAKRISAEQQLQRSVMACMLWEDSFYEDGVSISDRISSLIKEVDPMFAWQTAVTARSKFHLRHVPLFIVREMARLSTHKHLVSDALFEVIQRPDELCEFLAMYWKDGRQPLSAQVKKGLARAFGKFNEYSLAKYNRDNAIKLRDVLFLCHAKPVDKIQQDLWTRLINNELQTPDTWEVALSSGGDKKEHWERLLTENRLGGLALLRNLRNMQQAGVNRTIIKNAIGCNSFSRVLPFRFIAAAKYAPDFEDVLGGAMIHALFQREKMSGHTILLVDVSGSMYCPLSSRSDLHRTDAAVGLAMLLREICESVDIYTFSNSLVKVPPRHTFALRDAIERSQYHGNTLLGGAVSHINTMPYDRLVVITDEQSHDRVPDPKGRGYMINVAAYKNGVGYGRWLHIDGFSEAVVDYIQQLEDFSR